MLMVMLAGAAAAAQSITVQSTASYRPSCSDSRCTDGLQMAAFDAENVVICYTVVDQFPACTLATFQGTSGTEVQLAATSSGAYAEVAVSALDSHRAVACYQDNTDVYCRLLTRTGGMEAPALQLGPPTATGQRGDNSGIGLAIIPDDLGWRGIVCSGYKGCTPLWISNSNNELELSAGMPTDPPMDAIGNGGGVAPLSGSEAVVCARGSLCTSYSVVCAAVTLPGIGGSLLFGSAICMDDGDVGAYSIAVGGSTQGAIACIEDNSGPNSACSALLSTRSESGLPELTKGPDVLLDASLGADASNSIATINGRDYTICDRRSEYIDDPDSYNTRYSLACHRVQVQSDSLILGLGPPTEVWNDNIGDPPPKSILHSLKCTPPSPFSTPRDA